MQNGFTNPDLGSSGGGPGKDAPLWDLSSIYSAIAGEDFQRDWEKLQKEISRFEELAKGPGEAANPDKPVIWLKEAIACEGACTDLATTIASYLYCQFSTDTTNSPVMARMNALDALLIPMAPAKAAFRNQLARVAASLGISTDQEAKIPSDLEDAELYIRENLFLQTRQMSPAEEDLAADLARAGSDAWSRLQEQLSSTMTRPWDEKTAERKTVVELRSLAFSPDRETRKKAYQLELEAWKDMEVSFAGSLNGVKGFASTLNRRRGYEDSLEPSLSQNRISRKTLDALLRAMEESLPDFRRYFAAKASYLGLPSLSFYDLFAPLPGARAGSSLPDKDRDQPSTKVWTYQEASEFIVARFGEFSPDLAAFAAHAFDRNWIDARPRSGKVGGAYCTDLPLKKVCRILANFDGSFSSLTTLAHELGHGYHAWLLKDEPAHRRDYPMTLAETASIFCETIVFQGALRSSSAQEALQIREVLISESSQVIVDILSRFYFESEVFRIREERELSAEEFCRLMLDAQDKTYGDALNKEERHPYMWAVKGHYYRAELGFYNYPYAFGQLFGLGLYAQYLENPEGFPEKYRKVLLATGSMRAEAVCRQAGFDIETPDFWRKGISAIVEQIELFCKEANQS